MPRYYIRVRDDGSLLAELADRREVINTHAKFKLKGFGFLLARDLESPTKKLLRLIRILV